MKTAIRSISYVLAGFAFALAVTAGADWVGPTAAAPGNNVPAPLNAGASAQYKQGAVGFGLSANPTAGSIFDANGVGIFRGALSVNKTALPTAGAALDVQGVAATQGLLVNGGFQLVDATPGNDVGKVLTADANGVGTWTTPATTAQGASPGVYKFTSSYAALMKNAEFRTWYSGLPGGPETVRPNATSAGDRNDEGWSETQSTVSKLCQFFTDGVALNYEVTGLGSDNNNSWAYWDAVEGKWKWSFSTWVDARDVNSVTCMTTKGIVRGASFVQGNEQQPYAPYTSICTTYWCQTPPPAPGSDDGSSIPAGGSQPSTGIKRVEP